MKTIWESLYEKNGLQEWEAYDNSIFLFVASKHNPEAETMYSADLPQHWVII